MAKPRMPTTTMPIMNAKYAIKNRISVHLRFLFIFSYDQGVSLRAGNAKGSVRRRQVG